MSGETLLTDLCAICHVNAIKYTCPRCGTHTCSLPCVKKHKAWAQCSGERNPAEYRKRADLATPSSIDKDFNFITTVERSLVRAEDTAQDRGITLAPARQLKRSDIRPKWEIEAIERGITVIKAPKGLSRGKQNKTHWVNQHKCILWTLEWVCPDNERVFGQCQESRSVGEAFLQNVGKRAVKRKRRLSREDDSQPQKAVKRDLDVSPQETTIQGKSKEQGEQVVSNDAPTGTDQLLIGFHFYLHKPNVPSKFKCMIPLATDAILRDILDRKVLLEFPTIYVMYEAPDQLALPFITEAEYEQQHGPDVPVTVLTTLEDGEVDEIEEIALPTNVDSQKVLEVLARDLAG